MRKLFFLGAFGAAALLLGGCDRYPHPWSGYHEEPLAPDVAPSPVAQPAPIALPPPPPPVVGGAELFQGEQARSQVERAEQATSQGTIGFTGAKGAVCTCTCEQPPSEGSSAASPNESKENASGAKGGATGSSRAPRR